MSRHRLFPLRIVFAFAVFLLSAFSATAGSYKLVTLEYPPYEFTENGQVKGLAVEVIREAFKAMNHEVTIEVYPWARAQALFKNGEVDGIFTFFKTPEREEFTLFGKEPVVVQPISFWALKDTKIEFDGDLSKLKTHTIGVVNKTSYGELFDTATKDGVLKIAAGNSIEQCINMLTHGHTVIWISNRYGAIYELKRTGNLGAVRELSPPVQEVFAYVGFSKKRGLTSLRDDFDKALIQLKKSGSYDKILKNYLK